MMRGAKLIKSLDAAGRPIYQVAISEEHVAKQVLAGLALYPWIKVYRVRERIPKKTKRGFNCQMSTPGIPDLIGYATGRFETAVPVFIELKRPGGKHRPAQDIFIQNARIMGCIAFFAEGWDDVVRGFAEFGIRVTGN